MARPLLLGPLEASSGAGSHPDVGLDEARAAWGALAGLIAGAPRVRMGVRTSRGALEYRTRDERPLTKALPSAPAAVRVYGPDGCCAALCLDLDASRGGPAAVRADAQRLCTWLTGHGARYVTDASPSGGVHVYVPFAGRVPYATAREVVEALASEYPTVDAGPHRSLKTGCIRVPGSAHKAGGHQALTMTLGAAYDVLRRPNLAGVLEAMRADLSAQIGAWRTAQTVPDTFGAPSDPGRVGRLSSRLQLIAQTGQWDTTRYRSPSEARQAVVDGAVRAGWVLADVAVRLTDGRWPGLASLYARYSPGQRHRALSRDWRAAGAFLAATADDPCSRPGVGHVRKSHTSDPQSHGGIPGVGQTQTEHEFVRTWRTALRAVEQARFPGRSGYVARFVLRALGEAAHKSGSRYVGFGTRALAVACGVDHSTVAAVLRRLAGQAGGWIDLVSQAHGERADLYELTIPADLVDTAPDLRWDKGQAHALRPAFRTFGPVAALVFEAIEHGRAETVTALVAATGIARSSVHEATCTLICHGLLVREDHVLRALPHNLTRVAETLGVLEAVVAQVRRYARERAAWRAWLARHEPDMTPADPIEDYWWPPDDTAVTWTLLDSIAA